MPETKAGKRLARMLADGPDDWEILTSIFNQPPQGGGNGVAVSLLQLLDAGHARAALPAFLPKFVAQKQKRAGRIIGLGLHFVMGVSGRRDIIIAQYLVVMPGKQVKSDFMSFQPAVLGLRDDVINQDTLELGQI